MFVLGTAGHVDHGKSTLLRLLTGQEPDRLPEERRRGMTIDLNFLWMPSNRFGKVGLVDVPGHERFVKNMISGDSLIDGFIFVVAADDGWMPQSEEHLRVLKGLGVPEGIIVLSKVDTVDSDHQGEVRSEIESRFRAVGYTPRIVPYSSGDAVSVGKVKSAVDDLLGRLPPPTSDRGCRIWVDRIFQKKGQGTVVTGTLREGKIQVGQEVLVQPSGTTASVKSLQSYHSDESHVSPNSRIAIQLTKIDRGDLSRGDLLTGDRQCTAVKVVDVWLELFQAWNPKRSVEISIHVGSRGERALFHPFVKEESNVLGRVHFERPVPVRHLDRFILRTSGEERTLGSGIVVDIDADLTKVSAVKRLWRPEAATTEGNISYLLELHKIVFSKRYLHNCAYSPVAPPMKLGDWWVDKAFLERTKAMLAEVTEKQALLCLRKAEGLSLERGKLVLEALISHGGYHRSDAKIVPAGLQASPEENSLAERILSDLGKVSDPQDLTELLKRGEIKKALKLLTDSKRVVRLSDNHFLTRKAFDGFSGKVLSILSKKGQATTSELRESLGLNRKFAVMILERLDQDRVTYLKDGVRRLLKAP